MWKVKSLRKMPKAICRRVKRCFQGGPGNTYSKLRFKWFLSKVEYLLSIQGKDYFSKIKYFKSIASCVLLYHSNLIKKQDQKCIFIKATSWVIRLIVPLAFVNYKYVSFPKLKILNCKLKVGSAPMLAAGFKC